MLRADANEIITRSIAAVLPDEAVRRALNDWNLPAGRLYLAAVGKGAWQMARCAAEALPCRSEAKRIFMLIPSLSVPGSRGNGRFPLHLRESGSL